MATFILVNKVSSDRYGNNRNGAEPAAINVDAIRAFYARHEGRPGSRVTFTDGGGFAVSETPQELATKIASAASEPFVFPAPAPVAAASSLQPRLVSGADDENDDAD